MRRYIIGSVAIASLARITVAIQPKVLYDGDTLVQEYPNLFSGTLGTLTPWPSNTTTSRGHIQTTPPKIAEMHVPQPELQSDSTPLSVISVRPQVAVFHMSKGALFVPSPTSALNLGIQALGMTQPGPTTTPTATSLPAAGAIGRPTTSPATTSKLPTPEQAFPSPEVHSAKAGGLLTNPTAVLQPGIQAMGQIAGSSTTAPTSTTPGILMSGFVFSGTTYPALPMATASSIEQHSSQAALNPQAEASSIEEHTSQPALAGSTPQPGVQPATTTPADLPQITTPLAARIAANGNPSILISAFTFQGTAYPALPVDEQGMSGTEPQSSQPAAVANTASPEDTQPQGNPAQAAGTQPLATTPAALPTSTPLPAQQGSEGGAYIAGISVSGTLLPTTIGNNPGPQPSSASTPPPNVLGVSVSGTVLPTTFGNNPGPAATDAASATSTSTSLYISENPAGVPVVGATTATLTTSPLAGIAGGAAGAQSFVTSGRGYALTTDSNGSVSFRPQVTGVGGVWNGTGYGNGNGPGASGTAGVGGGNGTGAVVPYLGKGSRSRGESWREWKWFVALVVGFLI